MRYIRIGIMRSWEGHGPQWQGLLATGGTLICADSSQGLMLVRRVRAKTSGFINCGELRLGFAECWPTLDDQVEGLLAGGQRTKSRVCWLLVVRVHGLSHHADSAGAPVTPWGLGEVSRQTPLLTRLPLAPVQSDLYLGPLYSLITLNRFYAFCDKGSHTTSLFDCTDIHLVLARTTCLLTHLIVPPYRHPNMQTCT